MDAWHSGVPLQPLRHKLAGDRDSKVHYVVSQKMEDFICFTGRHGGGGQGALSIKTRSVASRLPWSLPQYAKDFLCRKPLAEERWSLNTWVMYNLKVHSHRQNRLGGSQSWEHEYGIKETGVETLNPTLSCSEMGVPATMTISAEG